jgi:sensor histidine kinase YesM
LHVLEQHRSGLNDQVPRRSEPAREWNSCAPISGSWKSLAERLRFSVECAADCGHLPFPPMLVQPLVENAVTHGIEPLRAGGHVSVSARRQCHQLVVTVEDSGVGLGRSIRHGSGTGVRTIRDRLEALFGSCASLELTSCTPQGTRAEIRILLGTLDPRWP